MPGEAFTKFPSPLGEMGLSIGENWEPMSWLQMFPSPLGEMGLSIVERVIDGLAFTMRVSVPSRGNGVIDSTLARLMASFVQVSVPSRGNGVIDTAINAYNSQLFEFPSPLGEMGLSIAVYLASLELVDAVLVSVPARGNRVIDLPSLR